MGIWLSLTAESLVIGFEWGAALGFGIVLIILFIN